MPEIKVLMIILSIILIILCSFDINWISNKKYRLKNKKTKKYKTKK